ncbi:MAG: BamA/TamA family outer membrane protein [Planctomycetota bacterium]|nr:BamA/TamA family outer membrane protein [Planctomycetota bacterium]
MSNRLMQYKNVWLIPEVKAVVRAAVGMSVAIVIILTTAGNCLADDWKFAGDGHRKLNSRQSRPVNQNMVSRYRGNRYGEPVIRAQYSPSTGTSVPALNTDPAWQPTRPQPTAYSNPQYTQPAQSYRTAAVNNTVNNNYQNPGTVTQQPGTITQSPGSQSGPVYVQPAQQYGQGPGFPPPLTGDASGQGPYVTDPKETGPTPLFGVEPDPRANLPHIPLNILGQETQTGRFMLGVGVNSEAGVVGSIVLDEQNFDWRRFPRSFEDIRNATAWRGAGQRFRLEAIPGTRVQRYTASFTEPYLLNSEVSLSLSGFFFTRIYEYWDEQRLGGRVAMGYHFSHALTGSLAYRGATINISDPYTRALPELNDVVGDSVLHGFMVKLAHDTRDSAFLATEGHLIETSLEQVVGTYQYPRFNLDVRKYFHFRERADQSGRHVVSLNFRMGITGDDTPIYDNFYAGGFSTIRGFYYRGASPRDSATGVIVGGHFQMLASAEYLFPITADDMLRGVFFCDTGTVEPSIDDWTQTYRVAPGFGLRIVVPAMGPAPIALDFAFPISTTPGDREQIFSFFVGFAR